MPWLPRSWLCAVNLSEVAAKLLDRGADMETMRRYLAEYEMTIVPFDAELAYIASSLRLVPRNQGLSLGDRACLALGLAKKAPVITAVKEWRNLQLGVDIELIR